jgi:hypothetical protein
MPPMPETVSHSDLRDQITAMDKRLIRTETRLEHMVESEKVMSDTIKGLSRKIEEIMTTLAGLMGEQVALKRMIPIALTIVTIVLSAVTFFVR